MTITKRIKQVQDELAALERPVQCLAVTKKVSPMAMREAYAAGLSHFGESYWQEAQGKLAALADLPLTWYFIGRLQSNKCSDIAKHFDWVLSVSHLRHAKALSQARAAHGLPPLHVCVQVNVDGEAQKDGVALQDLPDLLEAMARLAHVRVRGLMLMPAKASVNSFEKMAIVFQHWQDMLGPDFDTLSMGMSDDYQPAITAGSNLIRLGSALFRTPGAPTD